MAINDENNISFLIKTGVQRYIMGNILDFAKSHFSEDPKKLADFVRMVKRMSYNGITIMNAPGTIDPDYIGDVGVILVNLSNEDFVVQPGDRIAQMVINKFEQAEFEVVEELDETERGEGGYGHTGIK